MEDCALDCCGGQDGALEGREALEAGSEKRVNCRGDRQLGEIRASDPAILMAPEQLFINKHRHELFRKQRVAIDGACDPQLDCG